ncbi:MAG: hypothetical protein ACTSUQ_01340 [Candidatus Freyarchaeota archaeon]
MPEDSSERVMEFVEHPGREGEAKKDVGFTTPFIFSSSFLEGSLKDSLSSISLEEGGEEGGGDERRILLLVVTGILSSCFILTMFR